MPDGRGSSATEAHAADGMRVAIFNALYPTPQHPRIVGGAEVFVRQFAEALVEQGNAVAVFCASLTGVYETDVVNGVTVHFMPVRNLFPPFQEKKNPLLRTAWHLVDDWQHANTSIDRLLAEFRPDVVHSNTLNGLTADIWRIARQRKIPVVHTLHDYYLICPRCSRFKAGHSCNRTCGSCELLSKNRRRRADDVNAVVGVSQRTLDLHLEHRLFSTAVGHVVRNVPNPTISFSTQPEPAERLTIGYLGRFSEEKGVRLLVEAVGKIPPASVRLLLAGNVSEEERAHLKSLAPEADLEFVGFVAPSDFYGKVDVVAIPSIWEEPGALALVDALAAGRPILGTSFGCIREVVEDGNTGWISPANVDSLAAAIGNLIANPPLIAAAHQRLREKRDMRTFAGMVAEYKHIYQSVI